MLVLYVLFVPVGLWLLTEAMWQHGAPFRYRVLALIGFGGVVAGVALGNGITAGAGGLCFVIGQFLVTRSVRKGYYHGWTVRFGRKAKAKRSRHGRPAETAAAAGVTAEAGIPQDAFAPTGEGFDAPDGQGYGASGFDQGFDAQFEGAFEGVYLPNYAMGYSTDDGTPYAASPGYAPDGYAPDGYVPEQPGEFAPAYGQDYAPQYAEPAQPAYAPAATGEFASGEYPAYPSGEYPTGQFTADQYDTGAYAYSPAPAQDTGTYATGAVPAYPDYAPAVGDYPRPINSDTSAAPIPAPTSPPPGWADAPTAYRPDTGERLG